MSNAEQAADKKDAPHTGEGVSTAAATADKLVTPVLASTAVDEVPKAGGDTKPATTSDAPLETVKKPVENPVTKPADAASQALHENMTDESKAEVPAGPSAADAPAAPAPEPATPLTDKSKARRKSGPASEHKSGKKLSKKASRPRILNVDAQPGEHYLVKLKGFPPWPAIICDEDMLPWLLLQTRPVTARRADGTYREDYADGGKRMNDRTFPVMYLRTNEFGWVPNGSLSELTPDRARELVNDKMRKDLQAAYELAAEAHEINYYKDMLSKFQDEQVAMEQAADQAKIVSAKKSKKTKVGTEPGEDEDVDMLDAAGDESPTSEKAKSKKRKADEDTAVPQRSESVKKPKIKLTTSSTPKTTNGIPTPKSAKEQPASKSAKPKQKKIGEEKKPTKEAAVPKEPEMTAEERHQRKEKEVLFLRHKLQKGLLTRDQEPKEDEMKTMSEYVHKLEQFTELEVSIIRVTKINKVLKAILKLESIPREDEFHFKTRSQALLDKWNKLLASDVPAAASAPSNGVNGSAAEATDVQSSKPGANGVKADATAVKDANKLPATTEKAQEAKEPDAAVSEHIEKTTGEVTKAPETAGAA